MNMTIDKFVDLLRRIEACPDVMFTIDSNDSELAAEISEIVGEADDTYTLRQPPGRHRFDLWQ